MMDLPEKIFYEFNLTNEGTVFIDLFSIESYRLIDNYTEIATISGNFHNVEETPKEIIMILDTQSRIT